MKVIAIIAAVNAMRAVDDICFDVHSTTSQKAAAWNELSHCRNVLIAELGAINITLESAPAVPDLAVGAGLPPVHAAGADHGEAA